MDLSKSAKAALVAIVYAIVIVSSMVAILHTPAGAQYSNWISLIGLKLFGFSLPLYVALNKFAFTDE